MSTADHHLADNGEKLPTTTTGHDAGHHNGTNAHGYDYRNPMAHIHSRGDERLAAFGGEFQPGLYKTTEHRKFANPAPLGLSAFALTTFVLSLINLSTHDVTKPNIVLALAFGYGGLVQLLAGMWEMAVGNTFGATALSSYGGFWIAYAILLTPSFNALGAYTTADGKVDAAQQSAALAFFLFGWFIFTTILLLCTLRSTVMFFLLFFTLDLAFLFLACADMTKSNGSTAMGNGLQKAGGVFGLFAAFLAWYNAFAGIADKSNSFFLIPVIHFPWSDKGREARGKTPRETV